MYQILLHMWKNRRVLLADLEKQGIQEPADTKESDYVFLLQSSQAWWGLIRTFKFRRLPYGFRLSVPSSFGNPSRASQGPGKVTSMRQVRASLLLV